MCGSACIYPVCTQRRADMHKYIFYQLLQRYIYPMNKPPTIYTVTKAKVYNNSYQFSYLSTCEQFVYMIFVCWWKCSYSQTRVNSEAFAFSFAQTMFAVISQSQLQVLLCRFLKKWLLVARFLSTIQLVEIANDNSILKDSNYQRAHQIFFLDTN